MALRQQFEGTDERASPITDGRSISARRTWNTRGLLTSYVGLASIYMRRGDLEQSISMHEKVLATTAKADAADEFHEERRAVTLSLLNASHARAGNDIAAAYATQLEAPYGVSASPSKTDYAIRSSR